MNLLEEKEQLASLAIKYSVYLEKGKLTKNSEIVIQDGASADIHDCTFETRRVAVKALRHRTIDNQARKKILREISVWSKLDHSHVLPLLGISTDFGTLCMVSPWMGNGNAHRYVTNNPQIDPRPLLNQIAEGLRYLHEHDPPVYHGDLKGQNVLISDSGNALLCDFGLSVLVSGTFDTHETTATVGTFRWTAPELFRTGNSVGPGSLNASHDVYAFGMTILELMTRRIPFHDIVHEGGVLLAKIQGEAPERPDREITSGRLTDAWWNVCSSCWAADPNSRPSIRDILSTPGIVAMPVNQTDVRQVGQLPPDSSLSLQVVQWFKRVSDDTEVLHRHVMQAYLIENEEFLPFVESIINIIHGPEGLPHVNDLDNTESRDRHALKWTLKSLTDDCELLPFVESIPDAIRGLDGLYRANAHLFLPLLNSSDPATSVGRRILDLLRGSRDPSLDALTQRRRQEACIKAIWALVLIQNPESPSQDRGA